MKEAARRLKEAALSTASEMMGVPEEGLELSEGRVRSALPRSEGCSCRKSPAARNEASLTNTFEGEYDSPTSMYDPAAGLGEPYPAYVSATQLAEVEVDAATGQVEVLRVVAAHDAGRPVFIQGVVGQIEGGIVMGMGFALKESFIPGKTMGLKQYRIPRTWHAPEVLCLLVRETDRSCGRPAQGPGGMLQHGGCPHDRECGCPCHGRAGVRSSGDVAPSGAAEWGCPRVRGRSRSGLVARFD